MGSKRVEEEYEELVANNSWPQIYQSIGQQCQAYGYTFAEARKPANRPLNRYRDVNPYDHSRVLLASASTDYINANLVKMERAGRRYILTQGPLAATAGHFWLMVWEQGSRAIVMLNRVIEKNEPKCHRYWPEGVGEEHRVAPPDTPLLVVQTAEEERRHFTVRTFSVRHAGTGEAREVLHFHYTTWPDFEVPSSPVAFLDFLRRVRDSGALEPRVGPAVVHCSAGIGRSGTFCLVDCALVLIEREGQREVDVRRLLLELRRYRVGLIQTAEQLRFSYRAIVEGARRLDPAYEGAPDDERAPPDAPDDAPALPPRGASLAGRPLPAPPSPSDRPDDSGPASSSSSSADEGEAADECARADGADAAGVRRRRSAALAARVAGMRKRARSAERWAALKRSRPERPPPPRPGR